MKWDPAQYSRFSDERGRPFFDLTSRIRAQAPQAVVDLGCGSGELTLALANRWPAASVRGIDSSPEMIERALDLQALPGVGFTVDIAQHFDATGTDVLVSNAALQWVPQHRELVVDWAGQLNSDGWLAFQVPSNFDAPSHRLMRDLAASPRWKEPLLGVLRDAMPVEAPGEYLDLLAAAGLAVDVWQTEYLHVLHGRDPVLEWLRGTGLRPVLAALSNDDASEFTADFGLLLRKAYPASPYGTVFGFLRTFVVAHKN